MTRIPLTIQILTILNGMEYATTDALFEHFKATTDRKVFQTALSQMRSKRGFIHSEGDKQFITKFGRDRLLGKYRPVMETRKTFGAYLEPKPSAMPEVRSVMARPTWAPPAWTPARPGADAHKAYSSRGVA